MTTYPLPIPFVQVLVNGEDRTPYVERQTLQGDLILGSQVDQCSFRLVQPETWRATVSSLQPTQGQVVYVNAQVAASAAQKDPIAANWTRLFGGTVQRVTEVRIANKKIGWEVACVDFTEYMGRRLVQETYANWTVSDIVRDVVRRYAPQIRPTSVEDNARVVAGITFNFRYPRECLDELAGLIGWEWYVDPYAVLHFYDPLSTSRLSSLSLTDTSNNFEDLSIEPQLDQVRNRVYVQGTECVSDEITELWVCNGRRDQFPVQLQNRNLFLTPDTEGDLVVKFAKLNGEWIPAIVQGTADQSIAPVLIDPTNGVVTWSSDWAIPNDLDQLVFYYKYRYPLSVVVEDLESQALVAALAVQYEDIILNVDDEDPATPPEGYWQLSETAYAGGAADSSGNGRDGGYINFANADLGKPGVVVGDATMTAALFDGNNYVRVAHATALNPGGTTGLAFNPFAVKFWVRQNYADQTAQMIFSKGTDFAVRLHWHGKGVVSITSTTYGALGQRANLDTDNDNNCRFQLPDDQWHMVLFAFQYDLTAGLALVSGYLDDMLVFEFNDAIVINNDTNTNDLILGAVENPGIAQNLLGQLTQVALWNGVNVSGAAAARIYAAAQEDGVRETLVNAGTVQRAVEARAVGNIELAKWSRVVTQVSWTSYVHGWQLGDRVAITLTTAGSGRSFSGEARIQRLSFAAQGAQRLRWSVQCETARFNLIDYYRQLVRQATVLTSSPGAINKAGLLNDEHQCLLIDGPVNVTQLGLLQYVAPDNQQGGLTPYARVEYAIAQQGVFS